MMIAKLYDLVRCSKHPEHEFEDDLELLGYIQANRCPKCHPDADIIAQEKREQRKVTTSASTSAVNETSSSTLFGRCKECKQWLSLTRFSRHFRRKHSNQQLQLSDVSGQQNRLVQTTRDAETESLEYHSITRESIATESSFIEEARNFPVGRLIVGFENAGVFSTHSRSPRNYIGRLDTTTRRKHIHAYLDLLQNLLHNKHFIDDLLEYPPIKRRVDTVVKHFCA